MSAVAIPTLDRTTFRTSRLLDFCSRKELIAQTGHAEVEWPLVVLKELVDNALDACEDAGVAPVITVTVDADGISVADNGPGLPVETLDGVLDFSVRVSNREAYVAPDRGAQGNALKTIVAMPFVLDGTVGHVDVAAHGRRHRITLTVDRIRQTPTVLRSDEAADVTNGTVVRLHWPDAACSIVAESRVRFLQIAYDYAILNPHLTLTIDWHNDRVEVAATAPAWSKWRPSNPTSPHWYRVDHLERLVTAYIAHDADNGRERTVRELVAEFRGLSSTRKQKTIAAASGIPRAHLSDLWDGEALDVAAIERLLVAMKAESRPVKPADLGVIGREHLTQRLLELRCDPESVDYRKKELVIDGLPIVVETAFGHHGDVERGRRLVAGVNWSPGVVNPFRQLGRYGQSLDSILQQQRVGRGEPVVLVLHMACPGVEYTDRGKSAVVIGGSGGA